MFTNMYLGEKLQQQQMHKLDRINRTQWMTENPNHHSQARSHKQGKALHTLTALFGRG